MDAPKAKADLTTTQAVKLRARQFTAVAGDRFKVASASISRSDTQARLGAAARRCRRRCPRRGRLAPSDWRPLSLLPSGGRLMYIARPRPAPWAAGQVLPLTPAAAWTTSPLGARAAAPSGHWRCRVPCGRRHARCCCRASCSAMTGCVAGPGRGSHQGHDSPIPCAAEGKACEECGPCPAACFWGRWRLGRNGRTRLIERARRPQL